MILIVDEKIVGFHSGCKVCIWLNLCLMTSVGEVGYR